MSDSEPPSELQTMQSSPTTPEDSAKGFTVLTDVVCPYCADLCDDLRLTVERNHIAAVEVECPARRAFFKGYQVETVRPRIRGVEAGWDAAVEEAATILARARSPLVQGLSRHGLRGPARCSGACRDNRGLRRYAVRRLLWSGRALALQQVGEASCTLGEIKNRADLVVVWGADPMVTHPRHLSRYALDPRGLFVPNGRQDRKLIVVDNHRTLTAGTADLFLEVAVDQDYDVLGVLRALLKKRRLDAKEVGGRPLEEWGALLEQMKGCRYGIIFYGTGLTMSRGGVESVAQLLHLVNDLNAFTRFSVMAMRGPLGFGNVGGSYKVLCWQTGYPFAVSFARGYPRYNPGEFSGIRDACATGGRCHPGRGGRSTRLSDARDGRDPHTSPHRRLGATTQHHSQGGDRVFSHGDETARSAPGTMFRMDRDPGAGQASGGVPSSHRRGRPGAAPLPALDSTALARPGLCISDCSRAARDTCDGIRARRLFRTPSRKDVSS